MRTHATSTDCVHTAHHSEMHGSQLNHRHSVNLVKTFYEVHYTDNKSNLCSCFSERLV